MKCYECEHYDYCEILKSARDYRETGGERSDFIWEISGPTKLTPCEEEYIIDKEREFGKRVKALKKEYGGKLVFHGGADALLLDKREKILPYIEEALPALKENGGYIFSSDHSIPNTVSLEDYRGIVKAVKQFGAY